jgi:phosphoacetylglucosamine mutase
MLVDAFKQLTANIDSKKLEMRTPLYVDCAHGVGAIQLGKLAKELGESLHLEIINTPSDGELNHQCGAEYVQKARQHPIGFSQDADQGKRICSLDGDGDRVVFHFFDDEQGDWHLLDGDKIACLFADFFVEKIRLLELETTVGVVQTAYANGASKKYLESKGIQVVQAKTGVKFCHEKAKEFDIGIYFEANGHGTAMIKDQLIDKLQKMETTLHEERKKKALNQFLAATQLINQATGDAISDLLFVEVFLIQKNWTIANWNAIYQDLPSRQTKIKIADRDIIKVNEKDDTKVLGPENLRIALEETLKTFTSKQGRAFIRPSGTEDAVRIYAEAQTQEDADELALTFAKLVHSHAGGIGNEPTTFVA